ncbi:MAG: DUF1189 family protein [Elusimicrobia bacterium]|nr:DUF1189 family protein [Elusimicrobiota bacterium]
MFILDPVNAVTSIQFYRKVADQSPRRSFLYLMYLSALFTVALVVFVAVRVNPHFQALMVWMAQNVPPLTFADGKVTSPVDFPKVVRHPDFADLAVMIDTKRTDAVTPQMMEENKVRFYVTGNAVYVVSRPGRVEVNDLSKASGPPMEIGAQFYREFARIFPIVMYGVAAAFGFLGFFVWKAFATSFYWLVATLTNSVMDAGLKPLPLVHVALYAQTLGVALDVIVLLSPVRVSGNALLIIGLVATTSYIALALGALKKARAQGAHPQDGPAAP